MIFQHLSEIAAAHPERKAVKVGPKSVSYRELQQDVLAAVAELGSAGIGKGDVVLVYMPNGYGFVVSTLALFAMGAVVVPVNAKFPVDEIAYYVSCSQAMAIIYSAQLKESAAVAGQQCMLVSVEQLLDAADTGIQAGALPEIGDVPAVYMYSSGSTGKPKRVTRTQGQWLAEYQALAATIELTDRDRILCTVPLFHAHGFGNCMMAALLTGATLVLAEGEFNPRDTARLLAEEKISIYPSVPFMCKMIGETFFKQAPDLSALRLVFTAGAALPADVMEQFRSAYGLGLRQLYGSTETGAVAINYNGGEGTESSVGCPLRGVEIAVLNDQGEPVAAGETGEIAIRSPAMTHQYDGLPEVTRECFVGDYFLPGDTGRMDAAGNIFVTGRKKLIINVAGYKVDPIDVEDVIRGYPAVEDVVVLGVPHSHYGEMVKAVVVCTGQCSDMDIIQFCGGKLAEYKVPRQVEFRSEIPRSPLGKILRKYLQ